MSVIKRQYDIQYGPFTATPIRTARSISDVDTNVNYLQLHWMGGLMPVSLIFSKHGFSTKEYQTPPHSKNLWVVNLVPAHVVVWNTGHGQMMDISTMPALAIGSITMLEWGKAYIFQPQGQTRGVWFRAVDLQPLDADGTTPMIDEEPPMNFWNGNPDHFMLDDHDEAAMPSLLSRLQALTSA